MKALDLQSAAQAYGRAQMIDRRTASERIRAARRAQQIASYEREGWPLEVVQTLALDPTTSLETALDFYSLEARKVA